MEHCLRSRDLVNVVVAGKNTAPQWLDVDAAVAHCVRGAGIWDWASNADGAQPDVVLGCAGDVPTLEAVAAVDCNASQVRPPDQALDERAARNNGRQRLGDGGAGVGQPLVGVAAPVGEEDQVAVTVRGQCGGQRGKAR